MTEPVNEIPLYKTVTIKGEAQTSRMDFIADVLKKAKEINRNSPKGGIFNVDDILVEMAIWQQSGKADLAVFHFMLLQDDRKWRY